MPGKESDGLIMTPTSDETIARVAEISVLRQITDTLNSMGQSMRGIADEQKTVAAKLGEMHTDITVMKLQKEEIQALKDVTADHGSRIKAIELLNATNSGERRALATIREWSPFILGLLVAVFALIKSGLIHI